MDRRATRPRIKPPTSNATSPVTQVPESNGDPSVEPDPPSSEGDIPTASLLVEEIKSNDAVMYKIATVTETGSTAENVVVKGPAAETADRETVADEPEEKELVNGNGKEEVDSAEEEEDTGAGDLLAREIETKIDAVQEIEKDEEANEDGTPNEQVPKEAEVPKLNGESKETTTPKKSNRKQRELANLVIDAVVEEPESSEGPKSRYGRVHKLKSPAKNGEEEGSAKKKRHSGAKNENGEVGETPKAPGRQRKSVATGAKAEHSGGPRIEEIFEVPEKQTVIFPDDQKIVCSRDVLLAIPVKNQEAEFFVGDIIWSKITGYPFWPCMVTIDPLKGIYTEKDEKSGEFVYHVQYFGSEATRNWTKPKSIFKFEGYEHYKQLGEPSPSGPKRSAKKPTNKYFVDAKHRRTWFPAVSEAEFAMKMSTNERIEAFTYEYEQSDKPVRKRQATTPNGQGSKRSKSSSPEDIYDFDEFDDAEPDLTEMTKSPLRLMSLKKKGDFTVFVAQEKAAFKKSNPGKTEAEIDKLLENNWELLPEDQKLKYVNRTGANDSPSIEPLKIKLSKTVKPITPASLIAKRTRPSGTPKRGTVKKDEPVEDMEIDEPLVINEPTKTPARTPGRPGRKRATKTPEVKTPQVKTPQVKPPPEKTPATKTPATKTVGRRKSSIVSKLSSDDNISDVAAQSSIDDDLLRNMTSEDASSVEDNSSGKKEYACYKCYEKIENEKEELLTCSGTCLLTFHKKCIADSASKTEEIKTEEPSAGWKCEPCTTGNHICFICNESPEDSSVEMCSESNCGRHYHPSCLEKNYPHKESKNGSGFSCPFHFCLSCYTQSDEDNVTRTVSRRKMLYCLKCPTAYHLMDDCMAAGSVKITNDKIICPEHQKKSKRKNAHINVSFCMACMNGGQLICCERCPASFHVDCLDFEPPEGNFFCSSCLKRKQLNYNDIVWVKLGAFRWWPAKIILPKDTPDNVMKKWEETGQFPVFFFGTKDYNIVDKGRVFKYDEGDSHTALTNSGPKKIDQLFKNALDEAKIAYKEYEEEKSASLIKKCRTFPPYVHIRVNKPVGDVQQTDNDLNNESTVTAQCECDPKSQNPCSSDSDCLNRLMMFECNSTNCPVGDKCCNQRFKRKEYVKTKPFNTGSRGWGLKAEEPVKKGTFVIEYVGELIDEKECERRLKEKVEKNDNKFYFLTIDKDRIIDAGPKGNLARFMNHSCQPNCETQKWVVGGCTKVGLFAIQDIPAGQELTFNYNLDCRGNEKTVCGCGSKNCSNFIGVRPRNADQVKENGAAQKVRGRKRSANMIKNEKKKVFADSHEDECFLCQEEGELVMCDRKNCPKSYHMKCLELEKLPKGRWECPHHHCDKCGLQSTQMCGLCPNSLCKEHTDPSYKKGADGKLICPEHDEDEIGQQNGAEEKKEEKKTPRKSNGIDMAVVMEEDDETENVAGEKKLVE